MAANGISTLPTKEQRQIAKLNLAAQKRTARGRILRGYNINLLASRYVGNTNVVNPGPLVASRPWIEPSSFSDAFDDSEFE